jgi:hypothetical protein
MNEPKLPPTQPPALEHQPWADEEHERQSRRDLRDLIVVTTCAVCAVFLAVMELLS